MDPLLVAEPVYGWRRLRLLSLDPDCCFGAIGNGRVRYGLDAQAECLASDYGFTGLYAVGDGPGGPVTSPLWVNTGTLAVVFGSVVVPPQCAVFRDADGGLRVAGNRLHDAPHLDCKCGFYAMATMDGLARSRYCVGVVARVALSGRVVEHTLGFRAERQRVVELLLPRGRWQPPGSRFGPVMSCGEVEDALGVQVGPLKVPACDRYVVVGVDCVWASTSGDVVTVTGWRGRRRTVRRLDGRRVGFVWPSGRMVAGTVRVMGRSRDMFRVEFVDGVEWW